MGGEVTGEEAGFVGVGEGPGWFFVWGRGFGVHFHLLLNCVVGCVFFVLVVTVHKSWSRVFIGRRMVILLCVKVDLLLLQTKSKYVS